MTDRQAAIEHSLRRNYGMSPERREEVAKFLATVNDWYRYCKKCGKHIKGTREEVLAACKCSDR